MKGLGALASGSGLAVVATIVATPLLTRIYGPASFGLWASAVAVLGIVADVCMLRYEVAIVLPEFAHNAVEVSLLCVALALVTTVAVVAVAGVGASLSPEIAAWWWCLPLMVLATALHQISHGLLTRNGQFRALSVVTAALPMVTAGCQVGWGVLGEGGTDGLIFGGTMARTLVAASGVGLALAGMSGSGLCAFSWRGVVEQAVRYRNYPIYMTPYTLISGVKVRAAVPLVAVIAGQESAGLLAMAERVARLPGGVVASAIRPAFYRGASQLGVPAMEAEVARMLVRISMLATPLLVGFLFFADSGLIWAFGDGWRGVSSYASAMAVPAFFLVHVNWLDRGMDVLGKQSLMVHLEACFTVAAYASLAIGLLVFQDAAFAVAVYSAMMTLHCITWTVVFYGVAGYNLRGLYLLIRRMLVVGAMAAAVAVVIGEVLESGESGLVTYLLGVAGYTLLVGARVWRQSGLVGRQMDTKA